MSQYLPFLLQGGEALVIGLAAFLGAIPGIPAHDFTAAASVAVAKAIPGSALGALTGLGKKP